MNLIGVIDDKTFYRELVVTYAVEGVLMQHDLDHEMKLDPNSKKVAFIRHAIVQCDDALRNVVHDEHYKSKIMGG
jgi:hypothetical protein